MKTDLARLNILHFIGALAFLILIVTNNTNLLPFLGIVTVHFVVSYGIVRFGAARELHNKVRRAIISDNPGFVWYMTGLTLVFPIATGLFGFYVLRTSFDMSLNIFLCSSYALRIVANLMWVPMIDKHQLTAFD